MKIGIAFSLILTLSAFSQETWPRFRGENGAGVSSAKLPTTLGKDKLVWSTKLPGPGSSSPVIWQDKLFITGEDRESQSISLVCLDATTGKENWKNALNVGDYHLHQFNNTAAASPAVNDKVVVVSWFDGKAEKAMLTAFDHAGAKLWDFEIGAVKTQHGFNLHPVIHDDRVIISHLHMEQGYLAALSLTDGKPIWKTPYPGDKTSYVTPYIRQTSDGHEIIVASQASGVFGVDFATGKENWSLPGTMKERTIVSPINVLAGSGSDDCLIAVGCKNGVYFTVRPPTRKSDPAEIIWRMKGKTPYVPTPVSDGKTVFALSDGGVLTALDSQTGKEKWVQKMQANFYASPILADGKLYGLSREGEMIIADVSGTYQELSRSPLSLGPEAKWADATPAIAHGKIYLRLGARIDCFGTK